MPANSPESSAKYLLYSHYKALDQVQELGFIPLRLFRVLYPLWRVRVDGRQRIATEFDELEWFMERGIQGTGLDSVGELASFFGLDSAFVRRVVDFSRAIGHVSGDDDHLSLTDLGSASIKDRVRYEDRTLSTELYFDALGSVPLSPEHYKVPILEKLPLAGKTPFQAFHHFDRTWDKNALTRMLSGPDKKRFNLPDEVSAGQLLQAEPVYLPAYFVEARENKPNSQPQLLVFSQVRGLHDAVLEEAVNREPMVYRALKAKTDSRAEAVRRYFEFSGLKKDEWYLNENGPWGAQVMVDGRVFLPDASADEEESPRLTTRSVGRYTMIYDWCIWVLCDDVEVRKQAAAGQLVEWLQGANARPTSAEIKRKFTNLCQRLSIPQLPVKTALTLARQKGFARAAERLEEMEDG
jgi:hypothetical protein